MYRGYLHKAKSRVQRGFSLIELLIVIAIIGIIAGVTVASLNSARVKAEDSKRASQMQEIMKAMEVFYADNGVYPDDGGLTGNEVSLSVLSGQLVPAYLGAMPLDLDHGDTALGYRYCSSDNQKSMHLRVNTTNDNGGTEHCGIGRGPDQYTTNSGMCATAATDDECNIRFPEI